MVHCIAPRARRDAESRLRAELPAPPSSVNQVVLWDTKGGHICRVTINPSGPVLNKDGNPAKQEKGVALATVKTPLNEGQWYTMLVEVQGSQLLARIDDSHVGFGEHDGINPSFNKQQFQRN